MFLVKLFRISLTNERVFGKRIYFYHYPTFVSLFEELFVQEVYSFPGDHQWQSIVDCGANVGISVLFFVLAYPDAKIIAFEPDIDSFRALQKTCDGLSNVTLVNKAVSASTETRHFYYDAHNPGMPMTSGLSQ